jgi:hypothetical protein
MRHILLLAAVLMGSCGESGAPAPAEARIQIIASFSNQDEISVEYALRVLASHGISAGAWGSLGISIGVDESRAEEGRALLTGVPDIRPFVSPTEVSDLPVREWENDLLLDAGIQETLESHDETSLLGRILRKAVSRRPRSILERYPVVGRVKWRTREFVHRDMTPATAIEARVLFARVRGGTRFQEDCVSIFPQE